MEAITQYDLDAIADMIWWIKGYQAALRDNYDPCPFGSEHLNALEKVKRNEQQKLNEKEQA